MQLIIYASLVIIAFNSLMALISGLLGIKSSVLFCGIYGVSMKPTANIKAVMANFKILGLFNIPRGKDSCGVFIDGEIKKGVDRNKLFNDFIVNSDLAMPKENLVMLGHNRASTRGANTEANAHPFLINGRLVGVHNGTISNDSALCKKYNLNEKDFQVDSQILYTLLDNEGPCVLKDYKGFAALAYTYPSDPNTLYLYHGSSKSYKLGQVTEERPLFFVKTEDGLYFSSTSESLHAIRDNEEQEVYILRHNEIRQVVDGEFTDLTVAIDREESNIDFYTSQYSLPGKPVGVEKTKDTPTIGKTIARSSSTALISNTPSLTQPNFVYFEPVIQKETVPEKAILNMKYDLTIVYYHFGRHWISPRILCEGVLHIRKKGGYVVDQFGISDGEVNTCFFYRGVMLKDKDAYSAVMDLVANKSSYFHRVEEVNFAALISKYAMWPVTNMDKEGRNLASIDRYCWFADGARAINAAATPRYSGRHYTFDERGFLKGIQNSHKTNALYDNFADAALAVTRLCNKVVVDAESDTHGGGIDDLPFQDSCGCAVPSPFKDSNPHDNFKRYGTFSETTEEPKYGNRFHYEEVDDGDAGFFYELVYKDVEEAYQVIGEHELDALRAYIKASKAMEQAPLDLDTHEVNQLVFDLIFCAISSKVSIHSLCADQEDKELMIRCYDDVLSEIRNVTDADLPVDDEEEEIGERKESDDPIDVSPHLVYQTSIEDTLNEIKKQNEMNVGDSSDDILGNVENLANIAKELEDEVIKGDTYAEDVAFVINRGIKNLLTDIRKSADQFDDEVLMEKIDKLLNKQPATL